ncbi:Cellobiose 2-epimerase [Pseudoalteromonas sp. P1-30]|uniref:AGE family epimerase/isomerase n=1 Tax=Pseudoalteromonas sp. P1-30 TaxID=1723760 RepID=UPI0006D5D22A|nr:AGE family epimerase/isomerase [Pseudoalteromonas sp. P1-30]KPV90052.1 Cellobiose 2-epimerase [Pseudoalteromonas sp. P1-30]
MTNFNHSTISKELENIASWWIDNSIDHLNGGFIGEIDCKGNQVLHASKGIVLNSRILWFFSELALKTKNTAHVEAAIRSFNYIINYFDDAEFGGAVWELDYQGNVINSKKQTYAQCFCIYAFSSYFKLTGSKLAFSKAEQYFELVEKFALDKVHGGYIEAMTQHWESIEDFRLSEKDMNAPKSMNTHLHVLEAYTAFYQIKKDAVTKQALTGVLDTFADNIVDADRGHQKLFFDMEWNDLSEAFSYGHDIEASWLLNEAIEVLDNQRINAKIYPIVIKLASSCLSEAIGNKGQVCDEFVFSTETRLEHSDWWVQAEALVGFLNAYAITKDKKYYDACVAIWNYIDEYHLDKEFGEWHWVSTNDLNDVKARYKVGFWKAPYHNGRAMMELCRLFTELDEGIK